MLIEITVFVACTALLLLLCTCNYAAVHICMSYIHMYILNWYFITVAVTVDDNGDKVKEQVTAMLDDRVKC